MQVDLNAQAATWTKNGQKQSLRILPGHEYVHPSGYKVRLEKHAASTAYKLVGTAGEGVFCHKPSTVSGGGKSEISKSLTGKFLLSRVEVADLNHFTTFTSSSTQMP